MYDPQQYAEQTAARVAAAAAAANASSSGSARSSSSAASASGSGSSFASQPTPRSQFLGDLSRVLLGLSIVLQHSAALSNNQLADAARTFCKQNEKSWPTMQDLREIARERCDARNKQAAGSDSDATAESTTKDPNAPHDGSGSSGNSARPFDPSSLLSGLPHSLPSVSQLSQVPSELFSQSSRLVAQGEQVAESLSKAVEQTTREINRASGGLVPDSAIDGLVQAQRTALREAMRVGQQLGFASRRGQDDATAQQADVADTDEWQPTPHKNSNDAFYAREHIRRVADLIDSMDSSPQQPLQSSSRDWSQTGTATSNPVAAASKLVSDATTTVANGVAGAQQAVAGAAQAASQAAASTAAAAASTVASAANSAATTAASAASAASVASPFAGPFASAAHAPASSFNTFSDFTPRERTVPSSPLARIAGFSQIASSIIFGTIKDKVTGVFSGGAGEGSAGAAQAVDARSEAERNGGAMPAAPAGERASQNMMGGASGPSSASSGPAAAKKPAAGSSGNPVMNSFLSEANTERLAEGLCRMRGAALKVGQMLSIQDESLVPPQLQAVLDRVRDGADVMPRKQLERALSSELGEDWESRLSSFDWKPLAAASIGQVHLARLRDGREVVMKVQYPGVAESINSDVNNLKRLIRFVNVLPKGMYIDETMRAAKEELALECDYTNEALAQKKFKRLVANDKAFYVPAVIDEFSTKRILTTERIYGLPIDRLSSVPHTSGAAQEGGGVGGKIFVSDPVRNNICQSLLRLVLHELFVFRFMQTDPNWSNFLYNPNAHKIYLIDFGASRLYKKQFVDEYLRMVYACAIRDRQGVIDSSIKLGFLTGDESVDFLNAHVEAGFVIGEPFGSDQPYDFVKGNIAARVSALAAVMLRDRLTAPPKEAYTVSAIRHTREHLH